MKLLQDIQSIFISSADILTEWLQPEHDCNYFALSGVDNGRPTKPPKPPGLDENGNEIT